MSVRLWSRTLRLFGSRHSTRSTAGVVRCRSRPSSLRCLSMMDTTTTSPPSSTAVSSEVEPSKERFDPSISADEWHRRTVELLKKPVLIDTDILAAEETIRWWTTQRTVTSVERSLQLYERCIQQVAQTPELLQSEHLVNWDEGRYPRATHLLNAVVDGWCIVWERKQQQTAKTTILSPEEVFELIQHYKADQRTYSILMKAAVQGGCTNNKNDTATPLFCEHILQHMQDIDIVPDVICITTALSAWARCARDRPEAASRALALWHHYYDTSTRTAPSSSLPTTVTVNTVLHALVQARNVEYTQHADTMLQNMLHSPYPHVAPDTVSFRLVLFAWANLGNLVRAHELLDEMLELYQSGNHQIDVDATFFSKLVSGFAKQRAYDEAMTVYNRLMQLYQDTGDRRFEPDVLVTRAILIVHAKQGRPQQAQALLDQLEQHAVETRDVECAPKRGHYGDVFFSWTQSDHADAAEYTERILVRRMDRALAGESSMIPDEVLLKKALWMWSKSRRPDAALRAESLLRLIQQLYKQTKCPEYQPQPVYYQSVLTTWARSDVPDAAHRAEELLYELEQQADKSSILRPNRSHYTAVLTAWAKSDDAQALDHVQEVFHQAVDAFEAGHVAALPDEALYGALLHAYALKGHGEGAQEQFDAMWNDYYENGNMSAKPTTPFVNLVLLAWVRSRDRRAPERARAFLERIQASSNKETIDLDERSLSLLVEIFSRASWKQQGGSRYAQQAEYYSQQLKQMKRQRR